MTSKRRTIKRVISLLITVMMIAFIVSMAAIPASATINDAVREDANGVLQARTFIYVSGEKMVDGSTVKYNHKNLISIYMNDTSYDDMHYCTGTAFLINEDTALTCAHVVSEKMWDSSSFINLMKTYRNAGFDVDIECELVVNKDVTVTSKVISASEQDDYAVLKLSQALGGKTPLKLGDSDEISTTQTVYALGFPGDVDDMEQFQEWKENRAYDSNDVSISEGNIQKVTTLNNTAVIQHSATTSSGNSGGPIVDDRGAVVGVHKWGSGTENEFHWATAINEVKKVLSSLNIGYTNIGEMPEPASENEPEETEEKVDETKTEIQAAETVAETTSEKDAEENKGLSIPMIIGIIAGVVILIAVIIILIVVLSKKKNNNNNNDGGNASGAPSQMPQPSPYGQQSYNHPPIPPQGAPMSAGEGAGETSVLNDGAGETTVLGGATGFSLVRKSNNERIAINKPEFIIGKERRRVDYCISDDNSVSRTHAKIRVRSGKCYVTDLGSTNCTYVNGIKLSPNQEIELKSGDKIRVSDVEFVFNG